jgi:two-component system alkaline phosphatase synthesis response regulator PhoP
MIPTVLLVDDDSSTRELVHYQLNKNGLRVLTAANAKEATMIIETTPVDLLVLDLVLPDLNGFELCHRFRRVSRAPIIILSGRHDRADRVRAFGMGADDYITKPFSIAEFMARVRAHLRRWTWLRETQVQESEVIIAGPLRLDLAAHRAFCRGEELHLTPMEFNILRVLARAPGRVFSREQLLVLATGQQVVGGTRTVDVHIHSLRTKLGDDPANPLLETVRGAGYCFGRKLYPQPEQGLA